MSLRVKLISLICAMVMVLSLLVIGVYAVESQKITISGSVEFNVDDTTLYVKDVRLQSSDALMSETMEGFMPGYVNSNFRLNFGQLSSTTGSVSLQIDVVNTSSSSFVASTQSTINNETLTVMGEIAGDSVPIIDVATYEGTSGTIYITVVSSSSVQSINLDSVVIDLNSYNIQLTTTGNEPDGFYILTDSGEQYITGVGTYHFLSSFISFSYSSFTSTQSLQSKSLNAYSIGDVEFFAPGLGDTTRTLYFNEEVVGWYNITPGSTGWLSHEDFIEISEDYAILTYHPAQDTMTVIEF